MFDKLFKKDNKLEKRQFNGISCYRTCSYRKDKKCNLYNEELIHEYSVFYQEKICRRCNICRDDIKV